MAKVTQGTSVLKNEIEKNRKVSNIEAISDEYRGATYHLEFF